MVCDPRECDQIPKPEEQEGRAENRSLVRTVMLLSLQSTGKMGEEGRRGEIVKEQEKKK